VCSSFLFFFFFFMANSVNLNLEIIVCTSCFREKRLEG